MKKIVSCLLVILILSLSGCAQYQPQNDPSNTDTISAINALSTTWNKPLNIVWQYGMDEAYVYFHNAYFDIIEGHIYKSIIYKQQQK